MRTSMRCGMRRFWGMKFWAFPGIHPWYGGTVKSLKHDFYLYLDK